MYVNNLLLPIQLEKGAGLNQTLVMCCCIQDFGVCRDVLRFCSIPVLGVCLGHQGLCLENGWQIVHAPEVMHGRISSVTYQEPRSDLGLPGLFDGIPSPFRVVRYHSLSSIHENRM